MRKRGNGLFAAKNNTGTNSFSDTSNIAFRPVLCINP